MTQSEGISKVAGWTGEEILNNATDGIEQFGPYRTYSEIRRDDLKARYERIVENYDPEIDMEFADKIRDHQKTLWAIKNLEEKVKNEPKWDPRKDDWTNWDPAVHDTNRLMLKHLKEEVASWEK